MRVTNILLPEQHLMPDYVHPAHPLSYKHTHTNEKDTVYLMTSAHPTSGPHNLFSNFHHDEWTSFLITKLPKNKRKIFPKVLKVHINQSQFSLYSTSPRNQYKLKP